MQIINLTQINQWIHSSDAILISAGAGLSASGGLDYIDPTFFSKYYPEYQERGYKHLYDCIGDHWDFHRKNPTEFWGFQAYHIKHIRYDTPAIESYLELYKYIHDKNYFIITTNIDHQFYKSGFDPQKIFTKQGDFAYFQCSVPCSDEVYYNEEMIKKMVKNRKQLKIREEDIPKCPKCGALLTLNLRMDDKFVEKFYYRMLPVYNKFLSDNRNKNLVVFEMGVGFNSPGALRYPIEKLVLKNPKWKLIRLNLNHAEIPHALKNRSLSVPGDIFSILKSLNQL